MATTQSVLSEKSYPKPVSSSPVSTPETSENAAIDAEASRSGDHRPDRVSSPQTAHHRHRDVLHRMRTPDPASNPGPPPDGGFPAWSQALLAHLAIFNTWGFINSFGIFQTYYTTALGQAALDHLLDRQRPDLAPLLHRHFFRPGLGCGLFPNRLHPGTADADRRRLHDLVGDDVLAGLPRAGSVHRDRERPRLLPLLRLALGLLLAKPRAGHRRRGLGVGDGRGCLPRYCLATPADAGVSVYGARYWLRDARHHFVDCPVF